MNKTYQEEQNEFLEYLLYNFSYAKMSEPNSGKDISLELFITSDCNKKCEYCYLQKHKEKLYPQNFNRPDIIEKNCKILLDHFLERGQVISHLDLYSGEIIGSKLWDNILNIILQASIKGLNIISIMVPTNGSFLLNDEIVEKVEQQILLFRENKINLVFSFSDDGKVLDEVNRPLTSDEKQDKEKFYERAKYFAKTYHYGFHPMVNAHGIEKWPENFKWWVEYTKDIVDIPDVLKTTMFLEVRNDEWSDDKIEGYIKFLKTVIENIPASYPDLTKKELLDVLCDARNALIKTNGKKVMPQFQSYIPFRLKHGGRISCSITQALCVRLGDLAICPCHRLAYDHLLYGKYKVENDKIIGVEANNINLYINNMFTGYAGFLKCDHCSIKDHCLKGCRGAQYEIYKDFSAPIPSVCNLMRVKVMYCMLNIIYLIDKYNLTNEFYGYITEYTMTLNKIKNEDEEFYNKWKNIIYQYLLEI